MRPGVRVHRAHAHVIARLVHLKRRFAARDERRDVEDALHRPRERGRVENNAPVLQEIARARCFERRRQTPRARARLADIGFLASVCQTVVHLRSRDRPSRAVRDHRASRATSHAELRPPRASASARFPAVAAKHAVVRISRETHRFIVALGVFAFRGGAERARRAHRVHAQHASEPEPRARSGTGAGAPLQPRARPPDRREVHRAVLRAPRPREFRLQKPRKHRS
mmetsp:Transcript_15152/g.63964  ORF Transcript_15152/g.63964 Transcript_15152/m.63964 type:complete len:226 (+) Transcript_15152:3232-3909(+)